MSIDEIKQRPSESTTSGATAAPSEARSRSLLLKLVAVLIAATAVLAVIFFISNDGRTNATAQDAGSGQPAGAGQYRFAVGDPGPGDAALPIRLPSTEGDFDLESLRGQTVLLYFQEGLMCQPCWDQLKDIEKQLDQFETLGVDAIVSITTDPLDALRQKVADEELTTPVLSDFDPMFSPERSVQEAYQTNRYGMMGKMHSGHTFILVGPDGTILWRADYGGAPDYTMYLPVRNLIADMEVGLNRTR
ncbi:MAG: redoxin domain-containing protein [Actinomycetota bacterium]